MATRTEVLLLDDLDGGPANETISFGLDGIPLEIDLSDKHARNLRETLAGWIEHAREIRPTMPGRPTPSSRYHDPSPKRSRAEVAKERQWLRDNGYDVQSVGRIPSELHVCWMNRTPAKRIVTAEAAPIEPASLPVTKTLRARKTTTAPEVAEASAEVPPAVTIKPGRARKAAANGSATVPPVNFSAG